MHLSHYETLLIFVLHKSRTRFLKAPLAYFHASDILMSLFRLNNSEKDDTSTRENFATKKETSSPSDLKSSLGWEYFCSADSSPIWREEKFCWIPAVLPTPTTVTGKTVKLKLLASRIPREIFQTGKYWDTGGFLGECTEPSAGQGSRSQVPAHGSWARCRSQPICCGHREPRGCPAALLASIKHRGAFGRVSLKHVSKHSLTFKHNQFFVFSTSTFLKLE